MDFKKLMGHNCYLLPYMVDNAEKWAEWFYDPEIPSVLGDKVFTSPITSEEEQESITPNLDQQNHIFGIFEKGTDQIVGRIGLFNIQVADRHAMVGIQLGEKKYWGKGFGQDSMTLILDYAFGILNLHNVMIRTFEFNARSLVCYNKVGFKEIGRRRQVRVIAGKKYDELLFDILAEEFKH